MTHINIICENDRCDQTQCEYRHPKLCKYFEMFRRCKFTSFCKFSHKTKDFGQEDINDIFNDKIDTFVKASEALENNIEDIKKKLECVERELKEKNEVITELGDKMKILENKNEANKHKETILDDKMKTLQVKVNEKIHTIDSLKDSMDYCDEILAKQFSIHI